MVQRRTFQTPATAPETAGEALTEPADESVASVAADVTPAAESPLGKARSALAETDGELARLAAERDAALLRDDDVEAVRLDGEVEKLQRLRRAHVDKVALREREAERAAAEQRAVAKAEIIAGIELLLSERDRIGGELSANIEAADKSFIRLIELGREIRQRWQFAPHDANPAMLSENALLLAIPHEFYRLTARPHPLGGKVLPDFVPSFPAGSKAERIEEAGLPSKIKPLAKKLEAASALASRVMREGFSTNQHSAIPSSAASPGDTGQSNVEALPTTSPFRAEPNPELARLLERQLVLAMRDDPASEAEYIANGARVAALSA
jgi:hypothetical protein